MPAAPSGPYPALTNSQSLATAGALAVRAPEDAKALRVAKKAASAGVAALAKVDVSEEWKKADDNKIAKLRGVLSALQEENQNTQLLRKVSEDSMARRALEATRSNVNARLQACKDQEELFVEKQNDLRRLVMENEKRLQALEENIEKSQKRSRDEQLECRRLDGELRTLERELAEQEANKTAELQRIEHTSRYKEFLEQVVQECEEDFEGDIEVLMNRYATLEQGNLELHRTNREVAGRFDELRERHLRESATLQNDHLRVSSQLHECQRRLDTARGESQKIEQTLNRALEENSKGESEVGVIKMAIEQLFSRAVTSCRLPQRKKAMLDAIDIKFAPLRGDRSDARFDEMLRQIGERVEDLKDMYRVAHDSLKAHSKQPVMVSDEQEVGWSEEVSFVHTAQAGSDLQGSSAGFNKTGQSMQKSPVASSANIAPTALGTTTGPMAVEPKQETFVTQE